MFNVYYKTRMFALTQSIAINNQNFQGTRFWYMVDGLHELYQVEKFVRTSTD